MIDIKEIEKNYASMFDEQLIQLAQNEAAYLMPQALSALENELKRRNIDKSVIESMHSSIKEKEEKELQEVHEMDDDNFDRSNWAYVIDAKEDKLSDESILQGLVLRGLTEEAARQYLDEYMNKLQSLKDDIDAKRLRGGIAFLLGIIVTVYTYSFAESNGGYYFVAYGAILFGLVNFVKGYSESKKLKQLIVKYSCKE